LVLLNGIVVIIIATTNTKAAANVSVVFSLAENYPFLCIKYANSNSDGGVRFSSQEKPQHIAK